MVSTSIMATYRGLFLRLKDKHTGVQDKLKLAKFAWGNDGAAIPNKHQQILDYLCGLLVNKKRHKIALEDEISIWRSVKSFLEVSESQISVKASIIQVITDAVLQPIKSQLNPRVSLELLSSVVSAALYLLKIPSIASSHFENQCQLLSAVCQLHVFFPPSQLEQCDAASLLKSTVEVVIKSQLKHPNQTQIFTSTNDKLLAHALKCQEKCFSPELEGFLLSYLLHVDHKDSYSAFLKHDEEEQAKSWSKPPPKYISSVFSVFSSQRIPYLATSLLPAFVQRFISSNESDPRLCFLLFKYALTTTLGLDVSQTNLPSYPSAEDWMVCIAGFCRACRSCDLISANNDQNDVTKWFCLLTELVLLQKRDSSWLDYMTSLLSLSPLIVEKYLVTILQNGLTNSDELTEEDTKAQDHFLSELIDLYLKLRRTQDLVTALISAIKLKVSGLNRICRLKNFHAKLGVMFNEMPMMTLTVIWDKLIQNASDCVGKGQEIDSEQSSRLSFLFILLTRLLSHAKIFGQRSMGISGTRVEFLMNQMEGTLLIPLSKAKNVRKLSHFKELLNAWAMAKMLFYPKWRELPFEEESKKSDGNQKGLQKLYLKTDLPLRVRLSLQRHNISKAGSDIDMSISIEVNNTMAELLELPSFTEEIIFMSWNENDEENNLAQEMIVRFRDFANLFPLIGHHLNSSTITACAKIIVQVMSHQKKEGLNGTSLYQEVEKFLSHPATREMKALQSSIVSQIWLKLISLSYQDLDSPKKKKRKRESEDSSQGHGQTFYHFITSESEIVPELTLNLIDISRIFSVNNKDKAAALVQVLTSLDLECMRLINLKCQLGFLILSACLMHDHDSSDALTRVVERGLTQCLLVPNLSEFFKIIKPEIFLAYVVELCTMNLKDRQDLLSCVVNGVMNDRSAVLSVLPFVKQLTVELRESDCGKLPCPTKIQTCALLIHNCGRYISKNFHIQEVATAAMDIFCTLSKFTIKHSLKWLENDVESSQESPRKSPSKSKKKGKRTAEKSSQSDHPRTTSVELWCANLDCFSEVLNMWTNDLADERISEQLCASVKLIHKKIQGDVALKAEIDEKTKITQLKFLGACCNCHQRLVHGKNSMSPNPSPRSVLNDDSIAQIWSSCFSMCQSELLDHVSKSHSINADGTGSCLSIDDWHSWPPVVTACIDVLTSVMECVTTTVFSCYLKSMMLHLVPQEDLNIPAVFVAISVWRRLLQSTLLPEGSVREIFSCVYEFLSTSLTLMQHFEYLKSSRSEEVGNSSQIDTMALTLSNASSVPLHHDIWILNASRFLLRAMADYIDLAKVIITPRTILLCLQAGEIFSVTTTQDLEALQRLVNSFVVLHPVTAVKAAATVISLVSKLICSCVSLGFDENLSTRLQQKDKVVHCAQLVTRVLIVLASGDYKKELGKIAHCALADYIMEAQKGTLHTSVKKELVRGLYRLISVCDKYRLASLYTSLPPGVKDTFKFMHQDYEKYFRYKGNV